MNNPDFSDGVMVALKVPAGTAARLAYPGGTAPDDLHCTLGFLGNVEDLTEEQKEGVLNAAKATASDAYPLEGEMPAKTGVFENGDNGRPYWVDPGTPGIHNLREALVRNLQAHGVDQLLSTDHEFNPHVTLGYLQEGDSAPPDYAAPSKEPVTWTQLRLSIGPDEYTFPLGKPAVTGEQDSQPAPIALPPQPTPLAASIKPRVTPGIEHQLRRQLDAHNVDARLGQRTSIEALRAVYLRGASSGLQASARTAQGMDRVRSFLTSLTASAPSCADRDLYPPAPVRSNLYVPVQLAQDALAHDVADHLLAAATLPSDSPHRLVALNRALALASSSPVASVRSALPDRLRALIADGNSSVARSLRARRQLRDRYGRWIEQGGGVRFKVRTPGAPGGGKWFHGTVTGQDVPNGLVNVRLEDGREVAVPADKIEQPLALLRTNPSEVGDRPQDKDAPEVKPETPSRDDTGEAPEQNETQKALDDAAKELAKRVGDDSTEARHRDVLVGATSEATANVNTPEELRDHLAGIAEYADAVANGNRGRMTNDEREAFLSFAEDVQDIIAAQAPSQPARDREKVADLPDAKPTPPKDDLRERGLPDAEAPAVDEKDLPPEPEGEPVDTATPAQGLPELAEFADAANAIQAAHRYTDPDSPARDRLAAANNVVENVGDDFLRGEIDSEEALDALGATYDELDSILNDHFDDVSEGEDDINNAMDRIGQIRDKIQAWDDTPENEPAPAPEPEVPETPEAPAEEVPETDSPEAAVQRVQAAIEHERAFLDDYSGDQDPPQEFLDLLDEVENQLGQNNDTPEEHVAAIRAALKEYQGALATEDAAYQLEEAVNAFARAVEVDPPASAPEADGGRDPWANPPTPKRSTPAQAPADEPEPEAAPEDVQDEIDADPFNAERVHFEDMKADYENGLLPDDALSAAIQEMIADLDSQNDDDAADLADEIKQWFNRRQPVAPQDETAPPEPVQYRDRDGQEVNPGDWIDVGDGTIKGQFMRSIPGGVVVQNENGETRVVAAPNDVRKMNADEVESAGGDPSGRDAAPATPDGEPDQFGNPVPARMVLDRVTNLPGNRQVQVYHFDDDPDGRSKVDIAVGDRNGTPTYTVRHRNTARSNHSNWSDAIAAAESEREQAEPLDVERRQQDQARVQRQQVEDQARADDEARRVEGRLDDADREMPEGWTRQTMPDGRAVMVGPNRYRAFSDPDGKLHLLLRDEGGFIAQVGTFDDWPQLENAIEVDRPRRVRAQRDDFAEFLAGKGFSEDTVNAVRNDPDSAAVRETIKADPAYQPMADAHRDAMDVDQRNAEQRAAAATWDSFSRQLREMEDIPAGNDPSPAPREAEQPAVAQVDVPKNQLSIRQSAIFESVFIDMEETGEQREAEILRDWFNGVIPVSQAQAGLSDETLEGVRDELVGRTQRELMEGRLEREDANDVVRLADELWGQDVPNDPNDGLIEPVGIEPAPEDQTTPPPAPEQRVPDAQAPPASEQGRPAGAPAGQENRYHPDGVVVGRDGQQIFAGKRVEARRDGAQGTVVAVQQMPPYARIRFDDGRTLVRAANQLSVLNAEPQPANAAELVNQLRERQNAAVAPQAAAPAAPAAFDPAQARVALQAVRDAIPARIGRAGHQDAANVARRNAGFAIGDAIDVLVNGGTPAEARRHLVRAAQRLGFSGPEYDAIQPIIRQLEGEQPAGAPQAEGRPVDLGQGRMPGDWLVPPDPGNYGERALDPATPGVGRPGPVPVLAGAANPEAKVEDYRQFGDRAAEITMAARTRPSLHMLQQVTDEELNSVVAAIFNADGETTFGNDGYTVRPVSIHRAFNQVSVDFEIRGSSGRRIPDSSLTRTLTRQPDGSWFVYNALMSMPRQAQGSGFAAAWNRNIENWAIANDIKQVKVSAGLTHGGAVWALQGFDWNPEYGKANQASGLLRYIKNKATTDAERRQVTELEARIEQARSTGDSSLVPTPLELVLVGWRPGAGQGGWAGVNGMMGHSWHGIKHLDPEHPSYAQREGYARSRAAADRVRANENVANVSPEFAQNISNAPGLFLDPTEAGEVQQALSNGTSLAALTPATKRKLGNWVRTEINSGRVTGPAFEDHYNLFRALNGEDAADAPPAPLGVGEELKRATWSQLTNNDLPGWSVEPLGRLLGNGGINASFKVTNQASGQVFYVKNDTYEGPVGRPEGAGAHAEVDINQLLRLAGPGGWRGINENDVSLELPDGLVQQRVGDNLDLRNRPGHSGSVRNMTEAIKNLDAPDQAIRMFILDIAAGNGDRHEGNWMVAQNNNGRYHLFPIDHGLAAGGGGWRNVDYMNVKERIRRLGPQSIYQYMKRQLASYDAHSVEYMARQIIQDYKNALNTEGSVWWDPDFKEKMTMSLDDLEAHIRDLLRGMGH